MGIVESSISRGEWFSVKRYFVFIDDISIIIIDYKSHTPLAPITLVFIDFLESLNLRFQEGNV